MSKRCSSTRFKINSSRMNVLTSERDNAIITIATFLFLFHPSLFPPGARPRPFSVVNWWSKWISRDRDQFSPPALRLIIVAVQWRQQGYRQDRQPCVYNLLPNASSIASWICIPVQVKPLQFLHKSSLVCSGQWTAGLSCQTSIIS